MGDITFYNLYEERLPEAVERVRAVFLPARRQGKTNATKGYEKFVQARNKAKQTKLI